MRESAIYRDFMEEKKSVTGTSPVFFINPIKYESVWEIRKNTLVYTWL